MKKINSYGKDAADYHRQQKGEAFFFFHRFSFGHEITNIYESRQFLMCINTGENGLYLHKKKPSAFVQKKGNLQRCSSRTHVRLGA